MAKDQHIYKMIIDGDISNLEQSMTKAVNMMKQKYSEMDKAADKVTHLKELVDYIAQIDKGLSALQTKDPNLFKKKFDGMDTGLRKMMEEVFGTSKTQLSGLDVLKDKLNQLSDKSRVTDIKAVATEINQLYEAIGKQAPIKLGEINSKTKGADLERLKSELQSFATVWADVNKKINGGFTFGGIGGGSGSGSGSNIGTSIGAEAQAEIDKITAQIEELQKKKQECQEIINTLNKTPIVVPTNKKNDTKILQGLIDEYKEIQAKALDENFRKTATMEDNRKLGLQRAVIANKIKGTAGYIENNGSNKAATLTMDKTVTNAIEWLDEYYNNAQTTIKGILDSYKEMNRGIDKEIGQLQADKYSTTFKAASGIEDTIASYEQLILVLQEYQKLNESDGSVQNNNELDVESKKEVLSDLIYGTDKLGKNGDVIFNLLDSLDTSNLDETAKKLKEILNLQEGISENIPEKTPNQFESDSGKTGDKGNTSAGAGVNSTDFTSLESVITTEATKITDKLGGTLKVEIVKDSTNNDAITEKLAGLLKDTVNNANQYHAKVINGQINPKETMSLFGAGGAIAEFQGDGLTVDTKTIVDNLINNLKENILLALHTHPNGMNAFTLSDVKSFADLMYDQGIKMNGIIVGDTIKTIDFTGISKEVISKIVQSFSSNLADFANNSKGWYDFDGKDISVSKAMQEKLKSGEASKFGVSSELIATMLESAVNDALNQSFTDNGLTPAIKEFSLTQLLELSKYLTDIHKTGVNAIEPIEKLKNLITTLTQGQITDFGQFAEILNKFKTGDIDGAQAINQILNFKPTATDITTTYDSASESVQKFVDKLTIANDKQEELKQNISDSKLNNSNKLNSDEVQTTSSRGTQDINLSTNTTEVAQLEQLRKKLVEVEQAVRIKTAAFQDEGAVVQKTVKSEIAALAELLRALGFIKTAIENINEIFINGSSSTNPVLAIGDGTNVSDTSGNGGIDTQGYALNNTVIETNRILNDILSALGNGSAFSGLVDSLKAAVTELKSVANGIIQEEKAKKKALDKNPYTYDRSEVEARAKTHLDEYTAKGKQATVQFKDSGRYTITVLEEIDGLSKQIFQTFDENDDKIERTTATISNNQKIKLDNLQKIIEAGMLDNTVSDQDIAYQQYKKAADELESMNNAYRQNNDISDEEILKWNQQIQLVQQLGTQVEALIKKKKTASAELNEVFKSKRTKELGKANLDYTNLKTDINIPQNLVIEANNALKKIQNAVSEDDLKIAVNEWGAMKSKIQEAAVAQDLYIKKQKKVKDTTVDSAEKAKIALEKSNKSAALREILAQTNSELKLTGIDVDSRKLTDRQKEIAEAYKKVEAAAREYTANVNAGLEANTDNIIAAREELYKLIDVYKKDYNIEDARKKTFGTASVNRIVDKYKDLNNIAKSKEFEGSDVVANKLKEYTTAIEHLQNIYGKFKAGEQITGDQEQQFNAARDECNKYGRALEKLIATSRKAAAAATRSDSIGADFVDDENGRLRALKQYVEDIYGATATIDKFTDANNKLFFTIDNGDGTFSKMCAEINSTRNAINVTTKSTEESTSAFKKFADELKHKFKSIGAYLMASFSFQAVFQQIKKGVNYVREIDAALTELKKVTDETDETYNRFLQNMSKTASVVGSTVSDLTTMAAEWARLGYSIEEAGKLAESTAILLNVSEFSNATEASEALISTMQAFQYTADESQHVVDVLNEVGNNFAVSSDGIATALQDSASALMEGGNSLEQAVALIAAAMENWLFI